jgi:cation transport protein ChaC
MTDPFAHHPELRGRIADPETSFFRTFTVERLLAERPEMAAFRLWIHTDAQREAIRAEALAGHEGDLWIFAYGSLMWDPALRFAELRRARAEAYARQFILVDEKGGRGSAEAPGLMAGLDAGDGCDGLALRIPAEAVDAETEILFRREAVGPAYLPAFVPVRIGDATVQALTFLVNHDSPDIRPDLTHQEQVRYIATGAGFLGTSRDYLANIVSHFETLGIHDEASAALLRDVDAYRLSGAGA